MPSSYSHSALETFSQCPRKYAFQYIEKPDVDTLVPVYLALGQVVHDVLQKLYTTGRDGVLLSADQMTTLYQEGWAEYEDWSRLQIRESHYGIDDYIRIGKEMLHRYYVSFQPFRDGTLLGAELKLSFILPASSYRCSVRIDRLWKRVDGVIEIWDYKTGNRLPKVGDPVFRHQMGLYQLAVMDQYPQFQNIELVQYYLRLNEVVRYTMTTEELDEIAESIRIEIAEVNNAIKLNTFPVRENDWCNSCNYFNLCPAKRHARMLEIEDDDSALQKPLAERLAELAEQYIQMQKAEKEAGAELERLKGEILEGAKKLNVTSVNALSGQVKISQAMKQKFLTKTDNPDAFAQLSELARELGWDDYLKLDTNAVMKDLYVKLPPEIVERLAPFVRVQEETRVTVSKKKAKDDDENNT